MIDERLVDNDRIHLIEPTGYPEFVALMKKAYALVTDSGGGPGRRAVLGQARAGAPGRDRAA